MPRALITGSRGFIGSYLAPFLRDRQYDVLGTVYREDIPPGSGDEGSGDERIQFRWLDIRDKVAVEQVVSSWKPDLIVHLAAQSLVMPSWQDPILTAEVNVLGTLYLLEAVRQAALDPLMLFAGTSAQYGLNHDDELPVLPVKEGKEFRPTSPYAATKVAADALAYAYFAGCNLRAIRVRLFNTTGPGKVGDACSDFASGIAALEVQGGGILNVGNLDTVRDITDVRDAVRAVGVLVESGVPGEAYNVCSGQGIRMKDTLDILLNLARTSIQVRQTDKRPYDGPIFIGDGAKLRALGWQPTISLTQTLEDMLDYWRERVRRSQGTPTAQ